MVALPDRPHDAALPPRPQSAGQHDDRVLPPVHRPIANNNGIDPHTVASNDRIDLRDVTEDIITDALVDPVETAKETAVMGLMNYADKHWDPHTNNPTTGQRIVGNALDSYESLEDKVEALSSKFIEEPLSRFLNWVFGKLGGSSGDGSSDNAQSPR